MEETSKNDIDVIEIGLPPIKVNKSEKVSKTIRNIFQAERIGDKLLIKTPAVIVSPTKNKPKELNKVAEPDLNLVRLNTIALQCGQVVIVGLVFNAFRGTGFISSSTVTPRESFTFDEYGGGRS
ncbi:4679_t:CDS:2 [Entrophospora sp. SA101]|nr:4679_t:CDS:2 [Entrophospora sp. SA101]